MMSKKYQMSSHQLLLLDNYKFHFIKKFLQYCNFHKIIVFEFLFHISHILQSLDDVSFQQYKHYYTKVINEAAHYEYEQYDEKQFFENLNNVHQLTFKFSIIKTGFINCRIYSVNCNIILD